MQCLFIFTFAKDRKESDKKTINEIDEKSMLNFSTYAKRDNDMTNLSIEK